MRRLGTQMWLAGIVLLLSVALCQAGIATKGTHEVMGSFSWDKFSLDDESGGASLSTLTFTPTYGYFFFDNFECQVRLAVASANINGSSDYTSTTWTPIVAVLGHAPVSGKYIPYLGVGLGASWFSDSEGSDSEATLVAPMVVAGGKMLVAERAAMNIELFYMRQQNALYLEDVDANEYGISLGFSVFFGPEASGGMEETKWHPLGW